MHQTSREPSTVPRVSLPDKRRDEGMDLRRKSCLCLLTLSSSWLGWLGKCCVVLFSIYFCCWKNKVDVVYRGYFLSFFLSYVHANRGWWMANNAVHKRALQPRCVKLKMGKYCAASVYTTFARSQKVLWCLWGVAIPLPLPDSLDLIYRSPRQKWKEFRHGKAAHDDFLLVSSLNLSPKIKDSKVSSRHFSV